MENLTTEKAVLANIVTYQNYALMNSLDERDFTLPLHRNIFNSCKDTELDFSSVAYNLLKLGTESYVLAEILHFAPPTEKVWKKDLRILRECRSIREAKTFFLSKHNPETLASDLIAKGLELSQLLSAEEETSSEIIESIKNPKPLIKTGFLDADKMLGGGIPQSSLFVVAAESGFGKSYMAAALAANALRTGKTVHFTSLEMNPTEVAIRVLKSYHEKKDHEIRNNIDEYWCFDNRLITQTRRAKILDVLSDMHKNCHADLFIVDYIGLCKDPSEKNNVLELGNIARAFKQFAMFHKKPVVALHQINREAVKERRRPTKSDLRGSGQIEEHADQVTFLWSDDKESPEVTWIFDKNRHGRSFEIQVHLDRSIGFTDTVSAIFS